MKVLNLSLYGTRTGRITQADDGGVSFAYVDSWLNASRRGEAHQVSVSLPLGERPYEGHEVAAFIAGLLPDSARHRTILADELGIAVDPSDFAFLAKLGRDCAGAMTIVPAEEDADHAGKPGFELLDDERLEAYIAGLPSRPLLVDEEAGVLLSLAGVNEKAAVVVSKGRIGLPHFGFPSTHIVKTDIPGLEDSIRVEQFCLDLAAACGQTTPRSEIRKVGSHAFMLMRRYDRHIRAMPVGPPQLTRVHQEDFCQALGFRPGQKYERHGGPGWAACFALMDVTENPVAAREALLDRAILQYLLGNPDAHGKNYSLMYRRTGEIRLAPFYDLNNAAAYHARFKTVKPLMAMAVGGTFDRTAVDLSRWDDFARECGLRTELVRERLATLSARIVREAGALREKVAGSVADTPLLDLVVSDIGERAERSDR